PQTSLRSPTTLAAMLFSCGSLLHKRSRKTSPSASPPAAVRATLSWLWKKRENEISRRLRCLAMTEGRSSAADWRTFPSSWAATTFRAFRKCKLPSITPSAKPRGGRCVAKLELFGTASCPYTQEMREWLEWRGCDFVEYDVERDPAARERMRLLVDNV